MFQDGWSAAGHNSPKVQVKSNSHVLFPHVVQDVIFGVVDISTPHVSVYESIMIYTLHVLLLCVFFIHKTKSLVYFKHSNIFCKIFV